MAESREFVAKVIAPVTKENEREMCHEFMAAIFGINRRRAWNPWRSGPTSSRRRSRRHGRAAARDSDERRQRLPILKLSASPSS
ncbi:MAG: hypothetical protein ACLTYW_00320 [Collinsella sp.]